MRVLNHTVFQRPALLSLIGLDFHLGHHLKKIKQVLVMREIPDITTIFVCMNVVAHNFVKYPQIEKGVEIHY